MTRGLVLLAVATASCMACSTLLGADAPIEIADAAVDAPVDAALDSPPSLACSALDGKAVRLVAGSNLALLSATTPSNWGVTGDGYVAYWDYGDNAAYIVRLAPGSVPIRVGTFGPSVENRPIVESGGDSLLLTPFLLGSGEVVPAYAFSERTGLTLLSSTTVRALLSADGSRVVTVELTPAGQYAVRLMSIDGSDAVTLVPSAAYPQVPVMSFAGSRNDRVVVTWCDLGSSGCPATHAFTVSQSTVKDLPLSFDGNGNGAQVSSDSSGDFVAMSTLAPGPLQVFDLTTGGKTVIDNFAIAPGFFYGTGSAETVTYFTPGSFNQSTLSSPHPVTLVTGTLMRLHAVSPDLGRVLLTLESMNGGDSTLWLASSFSPGAALSLSTSWSSLSSLLGDSWTKDSANALWIEPSSGGVPPLTGGALEAFSVSDGDRRMLDTGVYTVKALLRDRVAAVSHGASDAGGGDLAVYDLASNPAVRRVLATNVNDYFAPSAEGCHLVYTVSADPSPMSPVDGLWMVPVP